MLTSPNPANILRNTSHPHPHRAVGGARIVATDEMNIDRPRVYFPPSQSVIIGAVTCEGTYPQKKDDKTMPCTSSDHDSSGG